ncbi:MAG TPA: hypothetical protein VK927_09000, partial [Adhaeribacter sp.]|nr:hypothetical protein [Adhaeribacter sp.]
VVHQNKTLGIISNHGREVVPPVDLPEGYAVCSGWHNGLLRVCNHSTGKHGFIDRYGKVYFSK